MKPALFFLILSSCFYFFSYPEVDNDLWGHIIFGREIFQSGKIPSVNLYSYTSPDHGWINHEWLAEVIFYGVFSLLGSPGLILLKLVLGGGIIWMLDGTLRKGKVSLLIRILTLVWSMSILSPGFNVRPQIFTYFLFAVVILLLRGRAEKVRATLYLLPFFFALWVNLHGGFVAGLGAIGLFSLWTSIEGWKKRVPIKDLSTTILAPFLLSVLFLGLNPYGVDLLEFIGNDLLMDRPISEWKGIPLWGLSHLGFKLAALLFLISVRRDSWRSWHFILTLLALFLALHHQRHTPLFAIAAVPYLAEGLQRIGSWARRKTGEDSFSSLPRKILTVCFMGVALVQILWIGRIHWDHRFRLVVNPLQYPIQAVDFLQRNGVEGNVAVPFDWGEYFIWQLYPKVRVSIDGRYTTAYPMEVIEDSWEWMGGGRGWRRYLERYPAEIAVTSRHHPVTALLRQEPGWIYIYSDPVSFIFVKEGPAQTRLLSKFRAGKLLPPGSPPIYFPG